MAIKRAKRTAAKRFENLSEAQAFAKKLASESAKTVYVHKVNFIDPSIALFTVDDDFWGRGEIIETIA